MIGPLDKALTHGGRQVVCTVYDELQAFFGRVDQWAGAGETALAGPMGDLAGLLLHERDMVEVVRKGRAEAVLAFLKLRPVVRGVPDRLGETVRGWRASERSSAIQRILDEAMNRLPN